MSRLLEVEVDVKEARELMMKGEAVYCQDISGMYYDVDMITKGGEVASSSADGGLFYPVRLFVTVRV